MLWFRGTKFFISVWIVLAEVFTHRSPKEYLCSFSVLVEIIHWSWLCNLFHAYDRVEVV